MADQSVDLIGLLRPADSMPPNRQDNTYVQLCIACIRQGCAETVLAI